MYLVAKTGSDKMVHAGTSWQRRVCLPSVGFGFCRRWNQHQSQSHQPVCLPVWPSVCLFVCLFQCSHACWSVFAPGSSLPLVRFCPWFVFDSDSRAYVMMLVWPAVRPLVFVYEFILVRFWLPMSCFLVLPHSVCVLSLIHI